MAQATANQVSPLIFALRPGGGSFRIPGQGEDRYLPLESIHGQEEVREPGCRATARGPG